MSHQFTDMETIFIQLIEWYPLTQIETYAFFLTLSAVLTIGITVYSSESEIGLKRSFLALCLICSVWIISNYLSYHITDSNLSKWIVRVVLFSSVWFAFCVYNFLANLSERRIGKYSLIIPALVSLLTLTPIVFSHIQPPQQVGLVPSFRAEFGVIFFALTVTYFDAYGIYLIVKKALQSNKKTDGSHISIIVGILLTVVLILVFNLILPTVFNVRVFIPLGPIFVIPFIYASAIAIYSGRLFLVKKTVFILLGTLICTISLIDVFLATSTDLLVSKSVIFCLIFYFSLLTLRSIQTIEKQREQLEDFKANLERKVMQQTNQIRDLYTAEKIVRQELEKISEAKNQFIILTEHTLNAVYSRFMENLGNTQNLSSQNLRSSAEKLKDIISNLQSIRNISSTKSILNISTISIKDILYEVLAENQDYIVSREIHISTQNCIDWPLLKIDREKIKECISILIDNAIKYNKKSGHISISSFTKQGKFHLIFENSGVGINDSELNKLKSGTFFRGGEAKRINQYGMGIGLSVAKSILKSHSANLSIKSNSIEKTVSIEVEFLI